MKPLTFIIENAFCLISTTKLRRPKPLKKNRPDADSLSGNHLLRSANEYKIINTTYFYNTPDYNNRSDAYLTVGDATLKILDETNNFIHVIFINGKGKTTKGWLLKKDFTPANEY